MNNNIYKYHTASHQSNDTAIVIHRGTLGVQNLLALHSPAREWEAGGDIFLSTRTINVYHTRAHSREIVLEHGGQAPIKHRMSPQISTFCLQIRKLVANTSLRFPFF